MATSSAKNGSSWLQNQQKITFFKKKFIWQNIIIKYNHLLQKLSQDSHKFKHMFFWTTCCYCGILIYSILQLVILNLDFLEQSFVYLIVWESRRLL